MLCGVGPGARFGGGGPIGLGACGGGIGLLLGDGEAILTCVQSSAGTGPPQNWPKLILINSPNFCYMV